MSYVRLQSKKLNVVFHPHTTASYTLMLILWKRDFHYREKKEKKELSDVSPACQTWFLGNALHFCFYFFADTLFPLPPPPEISKK